MRILHIINNLGSGGAEKLIETFVPIMNKYDNVNVDILILDDKNNVFEKKLLEQGVKIFVVPIRSIRNPLNILYIRKFIIKGNYDVIHSHLFPSNYWTSIVSKTIFKNKPVFITTEHSTHNKRREKWYFRNIERFIYNNYDKVISVSNESQKNLLKWLKVKTENLNKFIVIENGIEIEKFNKAIPYYKKEINDSFNENTILLCMVGRFSNMKDQSTIIKAIKELPKNVHLLLIGDGNLKTKNIKLSEKLKLNNRVHFLGFRNDVERILKTVDIVILSSHWEGFGLSAVEGMAAGKPVIVSNVPGLSNVVGNEELLFNKGNSKELARKVNKLISDKKLYNKMSEFCYKRSRLYTIDRMVIKYLDLYRSQFQ